MNVVTEVPQAPQDLQATSTSGVVILNWSAISGATSYTIYRGTDANAIDVLAKYVIPGTINNQGSNGGSFYGDTQISSNTTYYYEITAVNSAGESAKSNEVSVTTQYVADKNGGI
jgi:fibronectin type 3 domain-containing protein